MLLIDLVPKVENRYLKKEIEDLLIKSGFDNIKFSDNEPFWHVLAYKKTKIAFHFFH